jgi:hypothetical protein
MKRERERGKTAGEEREEKYFNTRIKYEYNGNPKYIQRTQYLSPLPN